MTVDDLAQGVDVPEEEAGTQRRVLPAPTILAMCDRVLGEVGRRRHMFAWLRVPGSAADEWLPVDAYYPRARLVVMCHGAPGPHDGLYREQIPAHGLGLLTLNPDVLGDDADAIEAALAAKIFDLEHLPRPASREAKRAAHASTPEPARAPKSDAPAPSWTPVKVERTAVAPAMAQGLGLLVGLALAAILIVEVYLGVVQVAFTAGRVMLGFAIALEACSRAIGTVAAARSGDRGWAGACAIGGAPFVIWFAFWRPSGRSEIEPAPLAGLLAGVAVLLGVLALLFGL
jgi:hypothetical protein